MFRQYFAVFFESEKRKGHTKQTLFAALEKAGFPTCEPHTSDKKQNQKSKVLMKIIKMDNDHTGPFVLQVLYRFYNNRWAFGVTMTRISLFGAV